eukprot:gene29066-32271_t
MLSSRSLNVSTRRAACPSAARSPVAVRPLQVCSAVGKADLIDMVAEKTNMTKKDAGAALAAVIASIEASKTEAEFLNFESNRAYITRILCLTDYWLPETVAAGERVTLIGFGTFERRARSARTCRNPKTGEPIEVAAAMTPAFKAATGFKNKVNGIVEK